MTPQTALLGVAAATLLGACEARVGTDKEPLQAAPLEGSAEEGTFSMDLPGFEMKVDIPKGMQDRAQIDGDGDLIPSGATFRGIHVQGDRGGEGGVELRFSDARPPAELARWYREPKGREFTVASLDRQGEAFLIAGETRKDGDPYTVRLTPRAGGGTDGRLTVVDRSG